MPLSDGRNRRGHALRMATILIVTAPLAACTLLFDTSDLHGGGASDKGGGTGDAASIDDAGGGVALDGALEGSVEPETAIGCPAAGRSCVPEPPSGWAGPLLVYDGPENALPKCIPAMALSRIDAHTGFTAPAAHTCSACACANGSGATCTATLKQYPAPSCDGTANTSALTATCAMLPSTSVLQVELTSTGGSCPPTGGVASHPPPAWGTRTRACGAPTLLRTGCPDGNVCAPDAPNPFKARHCISREGEVACPADVYTERLVVVVSLADTRACTPCTCGTPENKCVGLAHTFTGGTCGGTPTALTLPQTACGNPPTHASIKLITANSSAPKCTPNGAATPTGEVKPSGSATICCAR